MKRIKQINESKQMISNAFIRLLQNHCFNEITVSMIALEAKIGRNTFYSHFNKKEDVVDYIMNYHFENAKENLANINTNNIKDILLWRFNLLKENPLLIAMRDDESIRYVISQFRNNKMSSFNFSMVTDTYKIEFIRGGINFVTQEWISNGMKESPEDITAKLLSYIIK